MADLQAISFNRETGFKTLFENSTVATLIVNKERKIQVINPAAEKLFGYERTELSNELIDILVPEDLRIEHGRQHADYYANPIAREMAHGEEVPARKKDGSLFPVLINLCSYHSGGEMYVIAFITDISEKKKAEEKIFADEKRTRLLIEHAPAAIAMLDTQMNYIIVSNRWLEDYHLTDKNIIGKCHYDVFPGIAKSMKQLHKRVLAGETLRSDGESFQMADGSIEWLKWEFCPWYAEDTKIGGIIIFSEIITEHRKSQQALEKLNEELEDKVKERTAELISLLEHEKELNEIKSRFVSTASHEFRTPLSVILSSIHFVESYSKPGQEEKRTKHIERIKASVKNLTELLNDFLSLERLEQGKLETTPEPFNLRNFCEDMTDEMMLTLKKGQRIELVYEGEDEVVLDKKILRNIITNLLSNAIKYSPENKEILFRLVSKNNRITIEVKDEGIGIPEHEQKNIFSKFYRASNAGSIQGTGLGLNIVNKYAELLGGKISFESSCNNGSLFTVTFPQRL